MGRCASPGLNLARMVTLGRPSLLAWLVGGLLGHDLRLVAPAELPPLRSFCAALLWAAPKSWPRQPSRRAAACRVTGHAAARRPAASGAVCHDANPSARDQAGPPPHAPLARLRQYQPSMTGTCPTVWFELCTACSGTLSPQPFTASLGLSSPAPLQPWFFAKIATCPLLRASTRAPSATLCTSRTTASSSGHGRQPHGEAAVHVAEVATAAQAAGPAAPPHVGNEAPC